MIKNIALASLSLALLGGCQSTNVDWQQKNAVVIEQTTIELKSSLWVDKMPKIGEPSTQEESIHAALSLESEDVLPAQLEVVSVAIKQGSDTWVVNSEDVDIRTHSENQWEIAFEWQVPVATDLPVDIAILMTNQGHETWIVERNVTIDTVY
ncbi:hypothetical protein [Vibrio sp. 10N.261.55.A7]|uniref:hypothetical protein n=1 Tax=Vibrio TaxID=662 RepID=UPI000C815046|nr:hypothetical protein [Vibrio sp. 10N.261.55.A7]PMK04530.1 hypothetical protein BCU12_02710 [Vibrio sp. 10N.261.55.A7]